MPSYDIIDLLRDQRRQYSSGEIDRDALMLTVNSAVGCMQQHKFNPRREDIVVFAIEEIGKTDSEAVSDRMLTILEIALR